MNEEHFDDVLDDIVAGKNASDADPLVLFARQIHEQEDDHLDDDRRTAIWRNLMATHAHEKPTTGGPGPLSQPALTESNAFNPWVWRSFRPEPKRTRLGVINDRIQVSITALAVVAIVVVAFVAFPVIRGDRSAEVTPTAFAAPTGFPETMLGASASLPATPDTGEDEDNEWLAYIQPEECTAESLSVSEIGTIIASPKAGELREYIPLSTSDATDAEDAARTARAADACGIGGNREVEDSSLMTDRFIADQNVSDAPGLPDSFKDDQARNIELGKQISAAYPSNDPADLMRLSDETPIDYYEGENYDAIASYAYLPSMAVQLPDGRVGLPAVSVFWTGGANAPTQEQIDELPWLLTAFVVLTDESGTWQVDELLPICLGDCEEGWAMWAGEATPPAATPEETPNTLLPLPGTPVVPTAVATSQPEGTLPALPQPTANEIRPLPDATWVPLTAEPSASPTFLPSENPPMMPLPGETQATTPTPPSESSVSYRHPSAVSCTVEPLTVDEVMAILEGTSSGRGERAGQLQNRETMDEETYDALAEAEREWLACRVYGSPFQMWALESDRMIIADYQRLSFPHFNLDLTRENLVQMRSELSDADAIGGFTWDPPTDTYIPMVPDYDANALPLGGGATLPIVWMNRDGDVLPAQVGTPEPSLESQLPNVWSFVWDEDSGQWLLDGYGLRWGVTETG